MFFSVIDGNVKRKTLKEEFMMNIASILLQSAQKYPTEPAVLCAGTTLTYKTLVEKVHAFAAGLQQLQVTRGDTVAIFMPNVTQFIISYFAITSIGAIAVPINARWVAREINYVLEHADAKVFITHALLFDEATKVDFTGTKITTGDAQGDWLAFDSLLTTTAPFTPTTIGEEDACTLLYTSGITGTPKGVLLTHKNVCTAATMSIIETHIESSSRLLVMLTLSHAAPLHLGLVASVLAGATAILAERFTPDALLHLVQQHRITHFLGVPLMYLLTAHHKNVQQYDLSSVKYWLYGGAPLPPADLTFIQTQLKTNKLVCLYGLTEAGPSGTILEADEHVHHAGSIGKRAVFGTQIRLVNDDFEDVPQHEIGEIVLYGDSIMKEYYNNIEATAHVLQDGWLRTGDLAKRDEEGYFYIVDRKKDVIFTGGLAVHPREVEEAMGQINGMLEVAVIGVPHPQWGETVKAIFAAKTPLNHSVIQQFLQPLLADYKIPRLFEQVDALPRTASGKLLKQALKQ